MDMLFPDAIANENLRDWRKLAQGLHARYLVNDFAAGARFISAVGEAGESIGHYPKVSMGEGFVDLKLVSNDAIYREDGGTEHIVEWVTQKDIDLARRITDVASNHGVAPDPASVSHIELGLDTSDSGSIAPVWAALLTGDANSQGRGTPGDEIRDASGRVPNLMFLDGDDGQKFHLEVYVAPEARDERITAAIAAGGTVVDESDAPSLTVVADQEGNKCVICVA